jgi:hypothetical protein
MWASIAALLGSELLKKFTFETAKWVAQRAFLLALCLGVGPVVIFWGYTYIVEHLLLWVDGYIGGQGLQGATVTVSGLGGWICERLKVGEALSIYLGFLLLSFSLKIIRVK